MTDCRKIDAVLNNRKEMTAMRKFDTTNLELVHHFPYVTNEKI
jgi:hypothetical protein